MSTTEPPPLHSLLHQVRNGMRVIEPAAICFPLSEANIWGQKRKIAVWVSLMHHLQNHSLPQWRVNSIGN